MTTMKTKSQTLENQPQPTETTMHTFEAAKASYDLLHDWGSDKSETLENQPQPTKIKLDKMFSGCGDVLRGEFTDPNGVNVQVEADTEGMWVYYFADGFDDESWIDCCGQWQYTGGNLSESWPDGFAPSPDIRISDDAIEEILREYAFATICVFGDWIDQGGYYLDGKGNRREDLEDAEDELWEAIKIGIKIIKEKSDSWTYGVLSKGLVKHMIEIYE